MVPGRFPANGVVNGPGGTPGSVQGRSPANGVVNRPRSIPGAGRGRPAQGWARRGNRDGRAGVGRVSMTGVERPQEDPVPDDETDTRPPHLGWPDAAGPHAFTPEGQIRQFGEFADGLRTNPKGVARARRMLLALAAAIALVVLAAVLFS